MTFLRDSLRHCLILCFLAAVAGVSSLPIQAQQEHYPFNDPTLPVEKRIDNLLSLMTSDEKIDVPGNQHGVPRLGVPTSASSEGIHGVVQRETRGKRQPITTTQFPQPPGMGESWDPDLVRAGGRCGRLRGALHHADGEVRPSDPDALGTAIRFGARSAMGTLGRSLRRGSVLERDDGRRVHEGTAGRRSEVLAGRGAAQAFSGERERESSQQVVVELRSATVLGVLFRSLPHGLSGRRSEGGDGLVQRVERDDDGDQSDSCSSIVREQWGVDVISSDGGAVHELVDPRHLFPDQQAAVVACLKAGINQFLDRIRRRNEGRVERGSDHRGGDRYISCGPNFGSRSGSVCSIRRRWCRTRRSKTRQSRGTPTRIAMCRCGWRLNR